MDYFGPADEYNPNTDSRPNDNSSSGGTSSGGSSGGGSVENSPEMAAIKNRYAEAQANGDTDGMNSAHADAQALRAAAGYDGGDDGSEYNIIGSGSGSNTSGINFVKDKYGFLTNRDADGNVYISQQDYDQQKALIAQNPNISFGQNDIRNANVKPVANNMLPSFGRFGVESGLGNGTGTQSGTEFQNVSSGQMQVMIDNAVKQGYSAEDVIKQFKQIDNDTWTQAMNIGAGNNLAGRVAMGEIRPEDMNQYITNPRSVMLANQEASGFWNNFDSALQKFGYDPSVGALERRRATEEFYNMVDKNPSMTMEQFNQAYDKGGYRGIDYDDFNNKYSGYINKTKSIIEKNKQKLNDPGLNLNPKTDAQKIDMLNQSEGTVINGGQTSSDDSKTLALNRLATTYDTFGGKK